MVAAIFGLLVCCVLLCLFSLALILVYGCWLFFISNCLVLVLLMLDVCFGFDFSMLCW